MSNKKLGPTENKNEQDIKNDDSVRINIEDVSFHTKPSQTSSDNGRNTENGDTKRKKEKDVANDKLEEIQLGDDISNKKYHVEDISVNKEEPVRKSRRTVIFVYVCPLFILKLFPRLRHHRAQPRPQIQRRGRNYAVFQVDAFTMLPGDYVEKYKFEDDDNVGEEIDRNKFVRKVFMILSVMLIITAAVTVAAVTTPNVRALLRTRYAMLLVIFSFVGTTSVQYTYCYSSCARIFPVNYSLNVLVTICYSYITSFMSARYAPVIAPCAVTISLLAVLLCLALAFTSFDFTKYTLTFSVALVSCLVATVLCGGLVFLFHFKLTVQRIVILILSSMASATMMVVEFQLILGGYSVELGDEEFTFGAYMVYTSIINIFLKLLGAINFASGGED